MSICKCGKHFPTPPAKESHEICYGCLQSQLAIEKKLNRYRKWFIMVIRDVLNYNEYSDIDMDLLLRCFDIAETCDTFTKEVLGNIDKMLLESGLSLLPVTDKAIKKYGNEPTTLPEGGK